MSWAQYFLLLAIIWIASGPVSTRLRELAAVIMLVCSVVAFFASRAPS